MTGWSAFATEFIQYALKVLILGATIVGAVFAGIGIRKTVNKKKEKETPVE